MTPERPALEKLKKRVKRDWAGAKRRLAAKHFRLPERPPLFDLIDAAIAEAKEEQANYDAEIWR